MPIAIEIRVGHLCLPAELDETNCALQIATCLPIEVAFNIWGEELYFELPVAEMDLDESATRTINAGDIAYWPMGNAMCLFMSGTVAQAGETEVKDVNLIGRILDDPALLREVINECRLRVQKK